MCNREAIIHTALGLTDIKKQKSQMKLFLGVYSFVTLAFMDLLVLFAFRDRFIVFPICFTSSIIVFFVWYLMLRKKIALRPSPSFLFIGVVQSAFGAMFFCFNGIMKVRENDPLSLVDGILVLLGIVVLILLLLKRYSFYKKVRANEAVTTPANNDKFMTPVTISLFLLLLPVMKYLFDKTEKFITIGPSIIGIIFLWFAALSFQSFYIARKHQIDLAFSDPEK